MNAYLKKHAVEAVGLLIVAAICGVVAQDTYGALILALIALYSVAISGLDILFGYSGQISFGHAGFFALGAYTSAILSTTCGLSPLLGIVTGSLMATLFGIIVAFPASKLVKHFLSLMTIAFGQMVFMFVNSTTWLTGGAGGIKNIPPVSIFGYELNTNAKCLAAELVVLVLILVAKHHIIQSRVGRALIAIKENAHAAQGLGINVRDYKILAFAVSAFMTGLAGGMYTHLVGFISPETFNSAQSTLFMTMLLFGGVSTLMGPVVGSAVLLVIKEVFQSLASYQVLVYGIFILIVLFFFPNGIVGIYGTVRNRMTSIRERRKDHASA